MHPQSPRPHQGRCVVCGVSLCRLRREEPQLFIFTDLVNLTEVFWVLIVCLREGGGGASLFGCLFLQFSRFGFLLD
ncbi:hypothetical protein Nepgr_003337 [Nepenthes gracilis]|uniref:Uncharacterized protein n=1 Tax=Nepenthes gracilis TaxID=150966 RepID=A0AAD3XDF2_NEPGR|nr:hypothetical protein Nepgr_003337 [Nepenthes gracilis]